jgi:hypothetical protein
MTPNGIFGGRLLRAAGISAGLWGTWCLTRQIDEEVYLREFTADVPSVDGNQPVVALVDLRRKLAGTITYDPAHLHDPRPLLRQSAAQTLRTGNGFCGENARAAILLLKRQGLRAHRLYLQGPRWDHVAVEHAWDGAWVLFDAHADPGTIPDDSQLGRLRTDEVSSFPNAYRDANPWLRATRFKALLRSPRSNADRLRPPALAVSLFERPYLVKAVAGIGVALACLGAGAPLRRRPA